MSIEINWVGVLLAVASTMVVGSIWYAPQVFGKTWMKLIGKDRKDLEKNGQWPILITLIVSFFTAYVLAHLAYISYILSDHTWMYNCLTVALLGWLGFTAARMITHDAFEGRRLKLTTINILHELTTFLVMGLMIGLFKP